MKTLAAKAFYKAGEHIKALELSKDVNQQRPTVNTLLLEAKVSREQNAFNEAIAQLESAEQVLAGNSDNMVYRKEDSYSS